MNNYKSLEYIANGIHAANKIQSIRKSNINEDPNSPVKRSSLSMLNEILQVIGEYSPEIHREAIEETLQKSNLYSNTYRNLTHHLKSSGSRGLTRDSFIGTLDIIKPILGNNQKAMIDKVLKLYEIMST